jgi:hypothetical protein
MKGHAHSGGDSYGDYVIQKRNKISMNVLIPAETTTGYVRNSEVFRGKNTELDNSEVLVRSRIQQSHTDHFCASFRLAEELTEANTGLIETIMKSRNVLPKSNKEAKI